jgi:tetratricopeptide (TPR) repeat protein
MSEDSAQSRRGAFASRIPVVLIALAAACVLLFSFRAERLRGFTSQAGSVRSGIQGTVQRLAALGRTAQADGLAHACRPSATCGCLRAALGASLDLEELAQAELLLTALGSGCPTEDAILAGMRAELAARREDPSAYRQAVKLLVEDPTNAYALYAVAFYLLRAGSARDAVVMSQTAVQAGRGPSAQLLLGIAAHADGNLLLAESAFSSLVEGEPANVDGNYNLALVRQKLGQYRAAREGYLGVLRLVPGHVEARYNLGVLARSVGAMAEAQHHLAKLEQVAPESALVGKLEAFLKEPQVSGAQPGP